MRRTLVLAIAPLLLVGSGVAVAHGINGDSLKQTSATFNATTVSKVRTATCTGPDGTYERTRASYTGTATSDEPTLNGPVRVEIEALVNTTTGIGVASGRYSVGGGGKRTHAGFDAVVTGGSLSGLAKGRQHGRPHAAIVANLSADFTPTGGFANGKLGGGTSGGNAVMLVRGGCRPGETPRPERVEARGAITAVSASSISVAGVTCAVPESLQGAVSGLQVGQRVEIKCSVSGGTSTLTRVSARR